MFQTSFEDIYIVIPAKDEERYIELLLDQIIDIGFRKIVLVNDNSSDGTRALAENKEQVVVIDHSINLGAGAATQTGIAYSVGKKAKIIATIDADLQHNPHDLIQLIKTLENDKYDLVIGSRFLKKNNIPKSRIFFNKGANVISWVLSGKYLSDSQSGLKAFNNRLAEELNLNYDGFEFCMEIIKVANSQKFKISEVPVDVIYTRDTMNKGQGLKSGLRILGRLISPFS